MDEAIRASAAESRQKRKFVPLPKKPPTPFATRWNSKEVDAKPSTSAQGTLNHGSSYADLVKELASTRRNLASNVTLLEEANQALSAQEEEISNLEEKYKQVSEEKEQLALEVAALRREKKRAGFIQLYHEEQATEENRKRQEVEKELEELKKKKFKFTFEAGTGDAE
ncbi:hypothetical protein JCM5350_004350 [Sporobolomyces pararoseus]